MTLDRPLLTFPDQPAAWRWFAEHHTTSDGFWAVIAKKGSPLATPTYPELLDVALCHGWIDSQRKALDDASFQQAYTPRRPRSPWSQVNRDKVAVLIEAGQMQPAGFAAIEAAKANGRWEAAYARGSEAEVPEDFLEALDANPAAKAFFATLNKQNSFAVYYRLNDAKKPETRARRIEKFVEMFARGEKVH